MENKKRCPKCGEEKERSFFHKNKQTKDGLKCWCKACVLIDNKSREEKYNLTRKAYRQGETYKEIKRNYYKTNTQKILTDNAAWRQTFKGRLLSYKRAAKKRNIGWLLSDDEFKQYWQQPCYYCGIDIETIGIDRIENDKGYFVENCVPCCTICNSMKMSLSQYEFTNKIKKIITHLKL